MSEHDPRAFPAAAVAVDIVVFTIHGEALHVLLIKRGVEPFLGGWALPGGFVNPDEDLDAAAGRELAEETGVTSREAYLEQLHSYGSPRRDPRARVVTVAYWAICPSLPAPVAGSDAAAAELIPVSAVERDEIELAFDHHEIVLDAVERICSSLESLELAAKFCPPRFTISELRKVCEAVWDTDLDKGNFQRMVRKNDLFKGLRVQRAASGPRGGRPASLWSPRPIGAGLVRTAGPEALEAKSQKPRRRRRKPQSGRS